MTSRNRQSINSSSSSAAKKKKPIKHRTIELNAIVDAAESANYEKDGESVEEGDEEEEEVETKPVYNADKRNRMTSQSSLTSPTRSTRAVAQKPPYDEYMAPGDSYAYLWNLPFTRWLLTWMAVFSVFFLGLNGVVFLMWLVGLVPGFPSSVMYYGFIFYFLFILTGILSLMMACSKSKTLYTLTIILLFISFFLALLIEYLIYQTIANCIAGTIDASCGNFYPIQGLLFLITFAIALTIFILLIIFAIMIMRIKQSYSTVDPFY